MFDKIKTRLLTISAGLVCLIISVIFNAESRFIFSAIILLSLFLFISIPYYLQVIREYPEKYNFYIVLNYLLYLSFLSLVKFSIFFVCIIYLLVSLILNYYILQRKNIKIYIDDYYSPIHFAIKNYSKMNWAVNITFIVFLFICMFFFTPSIELI